MRRKGELSPAVIDSDWPFQVALPARFCERGGYKEIHEFCKDLSLCNRGHAVAYGSEWFNVYCFAKPEDAQKFKERFEGEDFNPADKGRGSEWAHWSRPKRS
jgi:hypothetical protein